MREYAKTRFCHNLNLANYYGDGPWEIPQILPEKFEPVRRFVPFDKANTCEKREDCCVYFYLDDHVFDRIWYNLPRYVEQLRQFASVISPDWSLYTDWPPAVNLYNLYRNNFVGRYLQDNGVKVYPNVSWTDEKSYDWCFAGIPKGATVAVTSMCSMKHKESQRLFRLGYEEMMRRLTPETVIFHGVIPEGLEGNIVHFDPVYKKFDRLREERKQRANELHAEGVLQGREQ